MFAGNDSMEYFSAVGEQTANTEATNEEQTIGTAVSGQQSDDDGTADANSTPQPPTMHMRYDSYEAARDHYLEYSIRKGFSIRIGWSKKYPNKEYEKVFLVCTKAGTACIPKEDTQNPVSVVKKRKRSTVPRTGCQAHMFIKKRGGWYQVVAASDEHNHPLIKKPSLTKFLRAHRNIPLEEQNFIRMLHACNIPTSRQMQLMSRFYGRREDVPYIDKDVANLRASFRRHHKVNDMEHCVAYFKKMKEKDKDFFYKIKLDEEDRVENIYWIDGASRRAYPHYSDCISFDATYLTNLYKMPCAPFIGINNHGQSVQFGCGFLRNELTDSYVWLMEAFLEAMGGVAPRCIITDQDFAMRAAIDRVFPDAIHRNCRWHVMQNATEKMGSYMATHPELHAAFNACVNNSLTPDEFEANWNAMLDLHGERSNRDLQAVWEHRACWVPAYFMHDFFPFLQTTARSEGFNAVLKRYINPQNSIFDFLKQYESIQDKILNAERKAEADTALTEPDMWCRTPIEKQMAKAYTRNIFFRFQWELKESMSYFCRPLQGYRYELSIMDGPVPHYGDRNYLVIANTDSGIFSCNCCKFERDGVLCCHVLKVMTQIGMRQIPEQYILKRWSWDVEDVLGDPNPDAVHDAPRQGMPEDARSMMVLASMRDDFRKIAKVACLTNDGRRIVKTHMRAMKADLDLYRKREEKKAKEAAAQASTMPSSSAPCAPVAPLHDSSTNNTAVPTSSASCTDFPLAQKIRNPPRSVTKGRPEEIANKNPLDLATKKPRKCSGCKSTDHTIRSCPEKLRKMGLIPGNSM